MSERSLHTCEFGGCTSAPVQFMHHRPNNWHRKSCVTHALDFQAGAVRLDAQELCDQWDAGTLKVSRPVCGTVEI